MLQVDTLRQEPESEPDEDGDEADDEAGGAQHDAALDPLEGQDTRAAVQAHLAARRARQALVRVVVLVRKAQRKTKVSELERPYIKHG